MKAFVLAAAAEGEEPNPLIPHLPEIIWGFIFFAILVVLITKFVVPNFEKAYAARTAEIEGGIEEAQSAQKEAQAALEKYTAQLAEARHEAAAIREEAREQGAQIVVEMREQAQAESARIIAAAQAQIGAERQQAIAQLTSEVGGMATDLASRIVGESLADTDAQRRSVQRFIDELEGSAN